MRMYDVILKKRRGEELSTEEINYFVEGFTKGEIPDYQAAALLMTLFFNEMTKRETADLTMAMVNSGDVINLDYIKGIKVDKHSTGGVGDSVSLILTPMVAACGVPVAKMSGRGLGHTGGTIDKLEAFDGFTVELTEEQFKNNIRDIGIAIIGQTGNITPADKKLYALRDVTATVDNMALIASSIMSKKIAAGADAIVLDVKVGDGAFMKNPVDARALAEEMVSIGKNVGRKTVAVISDMDQPLGFAIGNSLEIIEAVNTLNGHGPKDLLELVLTIGSNMLILAEKASNEAEARKMLMDTIQSGAAINKLKEFVKAQGGESKYIDNPDLFPKAKYEIPVKAKNKGFISKIHAEAVGIIAMELGAGRATKESEIDLSVGIVLNKKRADRVEEGDLLATIYANSEEKGNKAVEKLLKEIIIVDNYEETIPLVYDIVK